jgi:glycosyltransferase involved in cell wall biosynthesis
VACKNIVPRLKRYGHEVLVFSPTQHGTAKIHWGEFEVVGIKNQRYGTDALPEYVQEYQPDVVITLYDEWVLGSWQEILGDIYLPWVVGHYDPMEPLLKTAVEKTWRQLALSEWGARIMREAGLDPRVVPLGVDPQEFRPVVGYLDSLGQLIDQKELKKSVGAFEDQFLVGMVAANIDFRKNMEAQIRVFADFNRKYKDTHLFIKTNPSADAGGWDINRMVNKVCGLSEGNPRAPISFPASDSCDVPVQQLCLWYNAFDVYLSCSITEGWGLPITEANACGVPAIFTNFGAMPEAGYGWAVDGHRELNILYSFGVRPDEQGIWNALEAAYKLRGTPEMAAMKVAAREHALQYNWDSVVERLNKELEEWQMDKPL